MLNFDIEAIVEYSKNDEEIYGFFKDNDRNMKDLLSLTFYGAQTKKEIGKIACSRTTFVERFRNVFANSKLKAIIFRIDGKPGNVEFIKTTKYLFGLTSIPHIYFTNEEQMRSSILVASNISLNVGERIVEVLIDDNGMTVEKIRQRIIGTNIIVKIICHANYAEKKATKFLLKRVLNTVPLSKLMIMEESLKEYNHGFFFYPSVVHDLIKIMSTSASKVSSLYPTLGYTISEPEHPILYNFINYLGEKKAATPAFLMVLVLKEHLKELKGIFGEKPKEIGFCIFDDFDGDSEAKKRVENGLKESCQLLGKLECSFIESV
uniref:Uncharacterized protein n=1 Tax=Panagrolaimus sp. PS1159 TaxID=55785 RepID=A0AC35GCA3_9BILA